MNDIGPEWRGRPAFSRAAIEAALDHADELVAAIEGGSLSPRILELRGGLAAALGDVPASEQASRAALDLYRTIAPPATPSAWRGR
jgi:hypothetical protein